MECSGLAPASITGQCSRRSQPTYRSKSFGKKATDLPAISNQHVHMHMETIIECNSVESETYPELWQLFAQLNTLWQSEDPCDVTIVVNDRNVDAHKKVLSHFRFDLQSKPSIGKTHISS